MIDVYSLRENEELQSFQIVSDLVRKVFANDKILKLGFQLNDDLVRKLSAIHFNIFQINELFNFLF